MPLMIPNDLSRFAEDAMTLDVDSVNNSDPVATVGSRRYDVIYTSVSYEAPHLYAVEYNGNEKVLARLRKILSLYPNEDGTATVFITKFNEPVDEENVKQYATQIGADHWNFYSVGEREENDGDTIHFHLIEGKIPENYGSLAGIDNEDDISPYELITQLSESVQSWY